MDNGYRACDCGNKELKIFYRFETGTYTICCEACNTRTTERKDKFCSALDRWNHKEVETIEHPSDLYRFDT
jgi:hypothetical protein